MSLANDIVSALIEGVEMLWEDRIDDLIQTYGQALRQDMGSNAPIRTEIELWAQFDPHPRKKYLPWIVKQVAQHKLEPSDANLDHLRDQLRAFERLASIPEFTGSRDILAYDWPAFDEAITASLDIRSQSEKERAAKQAKKQGLPTEGGQAGVRTISQEGRFTLLEIKDAVSLSWWAWRAYDRKANPNWKHPTIKPPSPEVLNDPANRGANIRDGKWCIRVPSYGLDYIRDEPTKAFYLVLKDGGPYVGLLLKSGQFKTLDNDGIDLGIAEEIYPVLRGVLAQYKEMGHELSYEGEVFENLRFVNGEVKEGEKFDDIKLDGSTIKMLPPNCTFNSLSIDRTQIQQLPPGTVITHNLSAKFSALQSIAPGTQIEGTLDASYSQLASLPEGLVINTLRLVGCPIAALPQDLEVKGNLNIEGTQITELPPTLKIGENMTWSEPLDWTKVKGAFYYKCMPEMLRSFSENPKLTGKSEAAKKKALEKFKPQLWQYFQTDKEIDTSVKAVFIYTKPTPREAAVAREE